MTTKRTALLVVLLSAAALAFSLWAFPNLPERVPSHWNMQGQDDALTYAECDKRLNGDKTRVFVPRPTIGQPIQGPIDRQRADALGKSFPLES